MNRLEDREIEQLVADALAGDPRVDPREITVRVQDGVVHLSGTVDSAAERRAAQEDVAAATEAHEIANQLALRNFVQRTDRELAQAVRQALVRDIAVDDRPVRVEAADGTVTLVGCVSSQAQKSAAENVAWWTPGVMSVVDRLVVSGICEPPDDPD